MPETRRALLAASIYALAAGGDEGLVSRALQDVVRQLQVERDCDLLHVVPPRARSELVARIERASARADRRLRARGALLGCSIVLSHVTVHRCTPTFAYVAGRVKNCGRGFYY
jgi:hypothetical protein